MCGSSGRAQAVGKGVSPEDRGWMDGPMQSQEKGEGKRDRGGEGVEGRGKKRKRRVLETAEESQGRREQAHAEVLDFGDRQWRW